MSGNDKRMSLIAMSIRNTFWSSLATLKLLEPPTQLEKSGKYYGYVEFEAFKQGLISKSEIEDLLIGYEHSEYASQVIKLIT